MGFYQLFKEQKIPASLDSVWDFISKPQNLKKITPEYMGFEIISQNLPEEMHKGLVIAYKVSPLLGIKLTWVSEITEVKHKEHFIDVQHVGPYAFWHHMHKLVEIPGGVLMTDVISYHPPLGLLGDLLNSLIIKKQLTEIFDYRFHALEKEFGSFDSGNADFSLASRQRTK